MTRRRKRRSGSGCAAGFPCTPREFPTTGDEYWAKQGDWHRALYEGGFFGLSWPTEYGGQEMAPVYDVILDEELAPRAPRRGPAWATWSRAGTSRQQGTAQRFLPGMINGTERWCQGFSEPGAGSDLASLTTTATRDGDNYVINGHKIWTSYSDVADWCLVLARTDPECPSTRAFRRSSSRCTSRGSSSARCR